MSINRDDIPFEGRKARRLFWEKCASRAPILYPETELSEDASDVARWADYMLDEWDKRWISKNV